jgi:tellurite resistance protein TerC
VSAPVTVWVGFNLAVIAILVLDLSLSRRGTTPMTPLRAAAWTITWLLLSFALCLAIALTRGRAAGAQFLTGYLVEYALSVDNLFVFLLLFRSFRVPSTLQRSLLSLGVLGAFVLRAVLILGGVALVRRFEWLFYGFAVFLVVSGAKMAFGKSSEADAEHGPVMRLAQRLLPMSKGGLEERRLVIREDGRWRFTQAALILVVIEGTDLLFALDSIPAVLGISRDPFIVYASNICAVLGLRSLFFLLAALMERLRYLHFALAAILVFIGAKMGVETWVGAQLPTTYSLAVVAGLLALSVLASVAFSREDGH